jgi:hypothetical protein
MNENEDSDHLRLRGLLQQAKLLLLPMSDNQQEKWVAESPLAQEISAILAKSGLPVVEKDGRVTNVYSNPDWMSRDNK